MLLRDAVNSPKVDLEGHTIAQVGELFHHAASVLRRQLHYANST